ncbi:MAG: hypothetical protein IPN89_04180 [Saprospiraceae bacterium]|nr:hypothetical protein [Saprospiraceae bacterium]
MTQLQNHGAVVHEPLSFYGKRCLHCYEPLKESDSYVHQACNKRFYGQLTTPQLGYRLQDLDELASKVI